MDSNSIENTTRCGTGDSDTDSDIEENNGYYSTISVKGLHTGSRCGYCKKIERGGLFGTVANSLTVEDYQVFIDRGWRRSGSMIYKIDFSACCCPYYTIRCLANDFDYSRRHKKTMRRLKKYILDGENSDEVPASNVDEKETKIPKLKMDVITSAYDQENCEYAKRKLKVKLEVAGYSEEKYLIFREYQHEIHKESYDSLNRSRFHNFLCLNPFEKKVMENVPEDCPVKEYGAYHQLYYLDEKLIAVGVLDILPKCVSSIYFFYDPKYSMISLGSFSALREVGLTQKLSEYLPDLQYYYMGYYIPTCTKMRYKGSYRPAELLDVITSTWVDFEKCQELMEKHPSFTSFIPDATGAVVFRDKTEDSLDFKPGLDSSRLDNDDLLILRNKKIEFVNSRCKIEELSMLIPELVDIMAMFYDGVGRTLFQRLRLCID